MTTTWRRGPAWRAGLPPARKWPVLELEALTGDAYEAWMAGLDPDSAEPARRLRADAAGVRFVEVVINGPKSWSAAELHDDVAVAYGPRKAALQDRSSAGLASTQPRETDPLSEVVVIRPAADQPPHSCAHRPPNPRRFSCRRAFPNTTQ